MWYGPWVTILTILFPPTDGFLVTPQRKVHKGDKESDFVVEVSKVAQSEDLNLQIVLIVQFKNRHYWPDSVERLFG